MPEAKPTANQKLRYERERRAWSQQEVADLVGTTPLNVGRWERGVTSPGPHFRQKLCKVFEKSAQDLGLVSEKSDTALEVDVPLSPLPISPAQEDRKTYWNVPYNRNLLFTGREEILAQLHEALLNAEHPVALTHPQAISGLGGIGKTQTAVEYAYRYRDSYDAVFWARADSQDLLISDFLLIAALLNVPQRNEQDQRVIVKAVIHWLGTHERWLLILDNADNLEMVSNFIPSAGIGHILITTRANSTGTVAQRIEIEKMNLDEGVIFLLRRMKRLKGSAGLENVPENMRKQAQKIVEIVDGLPLAIDQAGAYIEETGCSLSDYLKFFKLRRNRLLRMRGHNTSGHPEPVATTWSLSFERVERANPAAAELLRLCAFLHPDEIPESMLIEGATELGSILQPAAEDELELNEAIGELRKYSLVKRDPDKKLLNIHRLVQAVLKDTMDKEEQKEWVERTALVLNKVFPHPEKVEAWFKCQECLPHVQICTVLIEQLELAFPAAAQVAIQAGNYLQKRAQYTDAELLYQFALAIQEKVLGPDNLMTATSLNNLAWLRAALGRYDQAEPLYQRALAIRKQALGVNNPDVAESLNGLARLYHDQGKYAQAESLYQNALMIFEQESGPDNLMTATSLNNLGWLYYDQGKYKQAEPLHKRALSILEQELGSNHPDVAECLCSLGLLYYDQGHYDQAELLYQRALIISEQILGLSHPNVALGLNNLGLLYWKQGKYELAEPLFLRSLAIWEKILGPNHSDVATNLNNLGKLYHDQGKYEQSELLHKRALYIREHELGSNHPDVALSLNNLALLYKDQSKYEQSELLHERALYIREQELGSNHPLLATSLNNLANLYHIQGKFEQAEPLYHRALVIREHVLGAKHPDVVITLENYVDLLHKLGRESEAAAMEERMQTIHSEKQ